MGKDVIVDVARLMPWERRRKETCIAPERRPPWQPVRQEAAVLMTVRRSGSAQV
jgi:hypothetical protein